jgi:hypothetical protein
MNRSDQSNRLSPSGAARVDQILRLAKQTARQRRDGRRRLAFAAANLAFAVLALTCILVIRQMPGPSQIPLLPQNRFIATAPPQAPIAPAPPDETIVRILTDPTLLDRLSIHTEPKWESISDDELIQVLAEAGQQVGIIHADGQTYLMTR